MANEKPQPKASRNSLRYVALLFFVPLAFFFCLCFVLPTRWLAARSGDPYLANLGYGASLHQANCDIVLDGDSTAEVGLDPTIFEQQTHLKTCNIAEPDGVRVLNGNAILDQYLAQNAPPRVILFLFNAPNLNPAASPGDIGLFEGFSYRMRATACFGFCAASCFPLAEVDSRRHSTGHTQSHSLATFAQPRSHPRPPRSRRRSTPCLRKAKHACAAGYSLAQLAPDTLWQRPHNRTHRRHAPCRLRCTLSSDAAAA